MTYTHKLSFNVLKNAGCLKASKGQFHLMQLLALNALFDNACEQGSTQGVPDIPILVLSGVGTRFQTTKWASNSVAPSASTTAIDCLVAAATGVSMGEPWSFSGNHIKQCKGA
jgi:hypothetical protein